MKTDGGTPLRSRLTTLSFIRRAKLLVMMQKWPSHYSTFKVYAFPHSSPPGEKPIIFSLTAYPPYRFNPILWVKFNHDDGLFAPTALYCNKYSSFSHTICQIVYYKLQIQITQTADKMTVASHSGTFCFLELDDLSAIRLASLDLLQKMGVTPTEQARMEGATVEALSYYYQSVSLPCFLRQADSG